jgi:hypothetical protein
VLSHNDYFLSISEIGRTPPLTVSSYDVFTSHRKSRENRTFLKPWLELIQTNLVNAKSHPQLFEGKTKIRLCWVSNLRTPIGTPFKLFGPVRLFQRKRKILVDRPKVATVGTIPVRIRKRSYVRPDGYFSF